MEFCNDPFLMAQLRMRIIIERADYICNRVSQLTVPCIIFKHGRRARMYSSSPTITAGRVLEERCIGKEPRPEVRARAALYLLPGADVLSWIVFIVNHHICLLGSAFLWSHLVLGFFVRSVLALLDMSGKPPQCPGGRDKDAFVWWTPPGCGLLSFPAIASCLLRHPF